MSLYEREGRRSLDFSAGAGAVPLPVAQMPREGPADDPAQGSAPQRKRYSSSFGHRYAGQGLPGSVGSVGSAASGGEKGRDNAEPPAAQASRRSTPSHSSAFLTRGVESERDRDDEDISVFVQDIDSAKPLLGRGRGRGRERKEEEEEEVPLPSPGRRRVRSSSPPDAVLARSPPPGMMLTSEREVDEKLRRMNEEFLRSLEGLGGSGSASSNAGRERTMSFGPQRGRERERASTLYGAERERTTSLSGRYSTLGYRRGGGDAGGGSGLSRAPSHGRHSPSASRNASAGGGTGSGTNTTAFPTIFRSGSRTGTRGVYAHGFGSEEVIGRLEFDSEPGSGSGSGSGQGSVGGGMGMGMGKFVGGRGAGGRFDF